MIQHETILPRCQAGDKRHHCYLGMCARLRKCEVRGRLTHAFIA